MINKIILIISALYVVGCQSNNDYQHPISIPPPPNVLPPNKAPAFTPPPRPNFMPRTPYSIAQKKRHNDRKVLTFIVE